MAVITTRATAAPFATLLTKVRRAIGDPLNLSTNQRWSSAEIYSAINDEMAKLHAALSADPGPVLQSTTLAVAVDAESTALPSGIEAHSLYKVEDYTQPTDIQPLEYVDALDLEKFPFRSCWTLLGSNIAVRPRPSNARTLRIWTVLSYLQTSESPAGTDQHGLPVNHEELIVLGASMRLEEVDDVGSSKRERRYAELYEQFLDFAQRYRGPTYVRNTRNYF